MAEKFLGISFRSEHHKRHFILSMVALAISIGVFSIFVLVRQYSGLVWFLSFMTLCYGGISLEALVRTNGGVFNAKVWSVDCIWFNALMAGIFFLGVIGALVHKTYF